MKIDQDLDKSFPGFNLVVQLFNDSKPRDFKLYSKFREFILGEIEFWKDYISIFDETFQGIIVEFEKRILKIDNAAESGDESSFNSELSNLQANLNRLKKGIIYSKSELAKFLIKKFEENPWRARGAYDYIVKKTFDNINHFLPKKEYWVGLFAGSVYLDIDKHIEDKKKASGESIEEIHQQFDTFLSNQEKNLGSKFTQIDNKTNEIITQQKKKFNDEIKKYRSDKNKWDNDIAKTKSELDIKEKEFDTYQIKCKENIKNLENTYDEHLKLEAPARYWNKMHELYEGKGKFWKKYAIFSSVIVMIVVVLILYLFPHWIVSSDGNWGSALKGTLLLTVFVSVGVYIIRLFVKLCTSAFHLSRDALERWNLTLYYLALIRKGAIQKSESEIILQALFSRADTGLIKGESGPKMPKLDNILKLFDKSPSG